MGPFESGNVQDLIWYFGIKIFLVVWIVFVPIAITNRLEKIIRLLEEKK
ncbi:MAG TPA: hypothetical protein PLT76_00795 [Candidatus Omnitrophota bacterium]|nr:hypothetical protein [Candidatus Omnitrophota bacterium]HPB68153.1 hypothetical protein [Candidatus Omnitrophota bacterium]HQO57246.1 hypothetical protein [Candidatus Omnitrophota bacterium]HQP11916.1 hypothetical protein [Candidatus Omnitrophota bacterium]